MNASHWIVECSCHLRANGLMCVTDIFRKTLENPGKVIARFNFNIATVLSSITPSNIIAGSKTCGVFPYNPSAISVLQELRSQTR
jgi:hypothetical protein